jgi:hypothetical protein
MTGFALDFPIYTTCHSHIKYLLPSLVLITKYSNKKFLFGASTGIGRNLLHISVHATCQKTAFYLKIVDNTTFVWLDLGFKSL